MFLELIEGPFWRTWGEAPKGPAVPLPDVPSVLRPTEEELADLRASARHRGDECDQRAKDPRSAADILAAPIPKDADGDNVTDICMLGLVERPVDDALAIVEKLQQERWCWTCRRAAGTVLANAGDRGVPTITSWLHRAEESVLDTMGSADSPALFGEVLSLIQNANNNEIRSSARRYLRRFPHGMAKLALAIAAGADPTPLGVHVAGESYRDGGAHASVRAGLMISMMARLGREDAVRAAARELGLEAVAEKWIAMPPFKTVPTSTQMRGPKTIVLEGKKLDAEKIKRLFELFDRIDWSLAGRDIALLREALDKKSKKAIADSLSLRWKRRSGERWHALVAIGLDPDRAEQLANMKAVAHSSESYNQRRIERTAVDVIGQTAVLFPEKRNAMLTALGSMALDPIKQRKHMRAEAVRVLVDVAEALGLPAETLDDQTIPSLGLDANASVTLDWGGRPVDVRMTPALEIVFIVDGEKRTAQPSPRKGDSKKKLAIAKKHVERLRKEGRVLALGLGPRVSAWMRDRQRWSMDDFTKNVLGHPILRAVARGFVWGTFDDSPFGGKLTATFRVAEDGSLADVDDSTCTPSGRVGLLHPGELDPDLARRWGGVMADYELLSLVPQLELRTLTADEAASDGIVRQTEEYLYSSKRPSGWEDSDIPQVSTAWERVVGRYRLLIAYVYATKTVTGRVRLRDEWRERWLKWGEVDRVAAHEMLADLDVICRPQE